MTQPPTRVATLGAGYFSQFHRDSWTRMPEVDAVGVSDLDMARATATGWPAFDTLEAMVTATQPDLLDVIVPPPAQAQAIRTGLAQGVRAFVCQKPFCRSLDEARQVVAEVDAQGATLVIHENFRFQPWYRAIAATLQAGRLGTVQQATFRLRPGDGQGPDAYLDRQPYFRQMPRFLIHETAVHWVDTFRYLFGPPSAVYADLRRLNPVIEGEDAGFVLFDHRGGVRSLFDGNRHLDHAADNQRRTMGEAMIEGTEGSLHLRGDGSVRLRAFGTQEEVELLPPDTWDGFGGDCVHALQCHVIAGLRHGAKLENLGADYLTVIEIEHAIYASAEAGRKMSLPGPE